MILDDNSPEHAKSESRPLGDCQSPLKKFAKLMSRKDPPGHPDRLRLLPAERLFLSQAYGTFSERSPHSPERKQIFEAALAELGAMTETSRVWTKEMVTNHFGNLSRRLVRTAHVVIKISTKDLRRRFDRVADVSTQVVQLNQRLTELQDEIRALVADHGKAVQEEAGK
jgi:hypothetical protein